MLFQLLLLFATFGCIVFWPSNCVEHFVSQYGHGASGLENTRRADGWRLHRMIAKLPKEQLEIVYSGKNVSYHGKQVHLARKEWQCSVINFYVMPKWLKYREISQDLSFPPDYGDALKWRVEHSWWSADYHSQISGLWDSSEVPDLRCSRMSSKIQWVEKSILTMFRITWITLELLELIMALSHPLLAQHSYHTVGILYAA